MYTNTSLPETHIFVTDASTFVRGSASLARQPIRKRPHTDRLAVVKRQTGT